MAIAIMADVLDMDIAAAQKLVLLALANNANDAGYCWPSQATVARRASMSVRSVRDHLHALAADGYVRVLVQGNGRGRSTEYVLNVARIATEAADARNAAKAAVVAANSDDLKAANPARKAADPAERRQAVAAQPLPEPLPEPAGLPRARGREDPRVARAFRAYENCVGTLTPPVVGAITGWLDEVADGDAWVEAACEEATMANARSWRYIEAVLRRWRQDGFKAPRRGRAPAPPKRTSGRGW